MGLIFILIIIIGILLLISGIKSDISIKDRKWIDGIPKLLRKRRIK